MVELLLLAADVASESPVAVPEIARQRHQTSWSAAQQAGKTWGWD
jgi:hypothetical protein